MASGFKEIQHTADWALEVYAPEITGLLTQAALGMNWLMGVELAVTDPVVRELHIPFTDVETLLVAFLNDILYWMETDAIGFDQFDLQIAEMILHARLRGAKLLEIKKPIKAVTYHDLEVHHSGAGLETTIVFDV